jgi:membrane-associated protein
VSGFILATVASILYTTLSVPLMQMLPVAFVGALLGDHAGFYVGRAIGPRFNQLNLVKRNQDKIDQAEKMIRRFGNFALFIGRFVPAIRSLIPLMLGISEFGRLRYTLLDATACFCWALGLGAIVAGVGQLT